MMRVFIVDENGQRIQLPGTGVLYDCRCGHKWIEFTNAGARQCAVCGNVVSSVWRQFSITFEPEKKADTNKKDNS